MNGCLQALTKEISTPLDIAPSALETIVFYCFKGYISALTWRRGVVVSGVRRMNEVNARRARLVPGDRLRASIPSRYVTSQLGQLSLASLWGCLIEYQLRLR